MQKKSNKIIDSLKPLVNGTYKHLLASNNSIKLFETIDLEYKKDKISYFIKFIESKSNNDILQFTEDLNDVEKKCLMNNINKCLELNDSLQVYILACLTKQKISSKDKKLDYYELELFTNIKKITHYDYEIYHNMYKEQVNDKVNYITLISRYKQESKIKRTLKKFADIAVLELNSNRYLLNTFSETLFDFLEDYYKGRINNDILEKNSNRYSRHSTI